MKPKLFSILAILMVLSLLVACGPTPEPQTIIQTVEVEKDGRRDRRGRETSHRDRRGRKDRHRGKGRRSDGCACPRRPDGHPGPSPDHLPQLPRHAPDRRAQCLHHRLAHVRLAGVGQRRRRSSSPRWPKVGRSRMTAPSTPSTCARASPSTTASRSTPTRSSFPGSGPRMAALSTATSWQTADVGGKDRRLYRQDHHGRSPMRSFCRLVADNWAMIPPGYFPGSGPGRALTSTRSAPAPLCLSSGSRATTSP